jgi:hypothetical protein
LIKDNQQTTFQLNRRQKRSRRPGPLHLISLTPSQTKIANTALKLRKLG